jgi:DNA recombination protein RmuC
VSAVVIVDSNRIGINKIMNIILILIGSLLGFALSCIIFSLRSKVGNVSKLDYETLNNQFHETDKRMNIAEERLSVQEQTCSKLTLKVESKEQEIVQLQSKTSSLMEAKQSEINLLQKKLAESNAINKLLSDNIDSQKELYSKQAEKLTQLNEKLTKIIAENSTLTANNNALTEKLATQKEEITAIQKTAHLQFEKIAAQILEEKSGKFTEVNKANIEAILKPLGENIDNFKKKVEETYDKESKQRFSLEEKVKELVEQTNKVSSEANNLATALKGQAKKQGNWGEMILESILQQSGLVKNREYFLQQTMKDEEGKNLRPDVLVKLPDNRIIIIDSKVSLVAYDRFSAADTAEEQSIYLKEHLKSIYGHTDELSSKKYDNLVESLDFTMMFVPIEPAYLLAIQNDSNLWAYAYSKRILLISPTNLIA